MTFKESIFLPFSRSEMSLSKNFQSWLWSGRMASTWNIGSTITASSSAALFSNVSTSWSKPFCLRNSCSSSISLSSSPSSSSSSSSSSLFSSRAHSSGCSWQGMVLAELSCPALLPDPALASSHFLSTLQQMLVYYTWCHIYWNNRQKKAKGHQTSIKLQYKTFRKFVQK